MKETMSEEQIRFLEEQVRFFDMGCDAAEQCFRPLEPESPGQPRAVGRRYDSIDEIMIPMVTELKRLPKRLLVKAASDMIHAILGTGVDFLYGSRSQRAQREAGPAVNPVTTDSADSAAEATGH